MGETEQDWPPFVEHEVARHAAASITWPIRVDDTIAEVVKEAIMIQQRWRGRRSAKH